MREKIYQNDNNGDMYTVQYSFVKISYNSWNNCITVEKRYWSSKLVERFE